MRNPKKVLAGWTVAVGMLSVAAFPLTAAAAPAPDQDWTVTDQGAEPGFDQDDTPLATGPEKWPDGRRPNGSQSDDASSDARSNPDDQLDFDQAEAPSEMHATPSDTAIDAEADTELATVEDITRPTEVVAAFTDWVRITGDNHGLPFAVVDKLRAAVFIFDAEGHMIGAAPILIGSALGDDSAPGVGDRELADIPMADRTTPAGRFNAAFGPAIGTEHEVLWVDYTTAVSIHPVITGNRRERRVERLGTTTPLDNRITHGCINVPAAFYKDVVAPAFTGTRGVFYILPETRTLEESFPSFRPRENGRTVAIASDTDMRADTRSLQKKAETRESRSSFFGRVF